MKYAGQKKGGWFGNSQGHSLAARGVTVYMKRRTMVNPMFYARRSEAAVPFSSISDDVKEKMSMGDLVKRYPSADADEVRRKAIMAIDVTQGKNTMSMLERNGVDETMRAIRRDEGLRVEVREAIGSDWKMSYLHPVKVMALRKRMVQEDGR